MTEQPTEATYASDLKEWINQSIKSEALPLSHAKVEMKKEKKRADVLVYDNQNSCVLLIEVKRPEESASDPSVVSQALDYVRLYNPRHFATHNVNLLILWDAVTGKRIDQFAITYVKELDEYLRQEHEISESVKKFLKWYIRFLQGEKPKPIDEGIVEILHNYIQGIVSRTGIVNTLVESYIEDNKFRQNFDMWLVDNGWASPRGERIILEQYCTILAKQYLYIFVNKVMFYNVLKDRFQLPTFKLPHGLISQSFHPFMQTFFDMAVKISYDYETIFQTNFVDVLPIAEDTILELVKVIDYLTTLDYSSIWYDVLGKVFEKLIPEEDRHILGQFFTRSDVVDIIIGFCVKSGNSIVLDPGVGSGTFCVRSYYRLRYLDGKKTHKELLSQLWGIDIAKFPAHLSTINLAIRDLSYKENYPNIVYSDFFQVPGPRTSVSIGVQSTLHKFGIPSEAVTVNVETLSKASLRRKIPAMSAVVGNPPYTRQEEMYDEVFGKQYKDDLLKVIQSDFPDIVLSRRASIYAYFFVHGLRFIEGDGRRLGFVCLRSWLDVGYGRELSQFFLKQTKIVAVIESLEERWFPDAQMLPCITVLEKSNDKNERESNYVKFVQLKAKLSEFVPTISDERDMLQEINRWQRVDDFVSKIEEPERHFQFKEIEFIGKKLKLYEDEKIRIVMIQQKYLYDDEKWGKYLSAPSSFFKIIEKAKALIVPLISAANIRRGYTTGANEFFVFPNKFFTISEEGKYFVLFEKKSKQRKFRIEKEYLQPVMSKIKPYKTIGNIDPKTWILMVSHSKNELLTKKKQVLDYIEYGEKRSHVWRNKNYTGYHEHPTCASRKPWYKLEKRKKYSIFSPSIFWGRHLLFFNNKKMFATDCLDEIEAKIPRLNKAMCAIMNTTLQALLYEFSGRYIENRDKTISNEIKIYELKKVLTINPKTLSDDLIEELEVAFDAIINREIKLVHEEIELEDKKKLDRILFTKVLGLTEKEMRDIEQAAGELYRRRIERLSDKEAEEDEEE